MSSESSSRIDRLHRNKLKVLVDITNKCNLRCTMCHFSFDRVFYRKTEHLTPENFRKIAAKTFPVAHTVVLSAGSEPTVSPYFESILSIASEYSPPKLQFLTNGTLLRPPVVDKILKSGVTQIDVSIDGANASTYQKIRRGAKFSTLIENLKYLRDEKSRRGMRLPLIQFNLTLMRSNLAELESFVDLAEDCGVERIGARHLMPYAGLNVANESLSLIPDEADDHFRNFLARVEASSSVQLISFPDFFKPKAETGVSLKEIEELLNLSNSIPTASFGDEDSPFGYVDLPSPEEQEFFGAVKFSGWSLDRHEVHSVVIAVKTPGTSDPANRNWRVLSLGKFINGSRPDVADIYKQYLGSSSSGWECALETRTLQPYAQQDCVEVFVIAISKRKICTILGIREIKISDNRESNRDSQALYCPKPFESVYVDFLGNVYPYPDCNPPIAAGNLLSQDADFHSIWHGEEFSQLRSAIRANKPPPMCRTCPNFINRNVNDLAYFADRDVESGYAPVTIRRKANN